MPAHRHGLPTAPNVSGSLSAGEFMIRGVRFNMAGPWELRVLIADEAGADAAVFPISVEFSTAAPAASQEVPDPTWTGSERAMLHSLWIGSLGPVPPDPSNRGGGRSPCGRAGSQTVLRSGIERKRANRVRQLPSTEQAVHRRPYQGTRPRRSRPQNAKPCGDRILALVLLGWPSRQHKTVLDEFYRIAFRKRLFASIEDLQDDLDLWVKSYNKERPHQGRWCFGKSPLQTFLDAIPVAKGHCL